MGNLEAKDLCGLWQQALGQTQTGLDSSVYFYWCMTSAWCEDFVVWLCRTLTGRRKEGRWWGISCGWQCRGADPGKHTGWVWGRFFPNCTELGQPQSWELPGGWEQGSAEPCGSVLHTHNSIFNSRSFFTLALLSHFGNICSLWFSQGFIFGERLQINMNKLLVMRYWLLVCTAIFVQ